MSDLLHGARELREKIYRLEVLLEVEKGTHSRSWFGGKAPHAADHDAAIKRLTETRLIEGAEPPAEYRLTSEGREFLQDVRRKIGAGGSLDWTHADEIDFSKL